MRRTSAIPVFRPHYVLVRRAHPMSHRVHRVQITARRPLSGAANKGQGGEADVASRRASIEPNGRREGRATSSEAERPRLSGSKVASAATSTYVDALRTFRTVLGHAAPSARQYSPCRSGSRPTMGAGAGADGGRRRAGCGYDATLGSPSPFLCRLFARTPHPAPVSSGSKSQI